MVLAIIATIFLLRLQPYEARLLGKQHRQDMKNEYLFLPSLQKPPSPNGCTYVPGGGGTNCKQMVGEKNFAAHAVAAPPPPLPTPPPPPPLLPSVAHEEQRVHFGSQ